MPMGLAELNTSPSTRLRPKIAANCVPTRFVNTGWVMLNLQLRIIRNMVRGNPRCKNFFGYTNDIPTFREAPQGASIMTLFRGSTFCRELLSQGLRHECGEGHFQRLWVARLNYDL